MKIVLRIGGVLLLAFGMIGIIAIAGGVASHTEGFTSLNDLWGGFAFHALSMFFGALFLTFGSPVKSTPGTNPVQAGSVG